MMVRKASDIGDLPGTSRLSNDYFYRMLSPGALGLSAPYHREEDAALQTCFKRHPVTRDMNFVAVGGGELYKLRQALTYTRHYVCVEPLADTFINDSVKFLIEQHSTISYIPKRFEEVVSADLPEGNNIFAFLFNVIAYLEDPATVIHSLSKAGDIIHISTWAPTARAAACQAAYFRHLNAETISPGDANKSWHLNDFLAKEGQYFKKTERIQGQITDILILYL